MTTANDTLSHSDTLTRFLLPDAGVRGVHVQLTQTWQDIRQRGTDMPALADLLGQTAAAAALLTAHIKIQGRLLVQLHTHGDLRAVFAECTADGTMRGLVQYTEGADKPQLAASVADLRMLGDGLMLALTIENPGLRPGEPQRYQTFVPVEASNLAEVFEGYFDRSEQLPTRLLLAADAKQAIGIMLQKLPGDEGDSDGWERATHLFNTLGKQELLDTDVATLLHRLFHQENPQILAQAPLRFACTCSHERVAEMLLSLGHSEALAAATPGPAKITCEFCGTQYLFDSAQINQLFATHIAPSSDRLH